MSFEFLPQKLVYGGDALGHYQHRPVLVPRALPGERLEVDEVRTAKGVVHARPLRVLAPAPERVKPPCPYFGRCGGCQYQHVRAELQGAVKREILRETLRRIGKILWDGEITLQSGPAWNYRNHARLKVARAEGGRTAVGFFEAESHRLIPVDACLILSPRLNLILEQLRQPGWSTRLETCREVELLADDQDDKVMVSLRGHFEPRAGEALANACLAGLANVVSVALEQAGGFRAYGQPALAYRVGEFQYRVSPGSFFQASRFLLPDLVAAVTDTESGHLPGSRSLALDVFAGVGLFALPLARRFTEVIGVEARAQTLEDFVANTRAHGLENVRPVAQTTFDFLRRFAQMGPGLVVLDPPRAGVGANALKLLTALRPEVIHYVSCSPPTLARDLGTITTQGYRLKSIELFDLFPETYHIECLARLTL